MSEGVITITKNVSAKLILDRSYPIGTILRGLLRGIAILIFVTVPGERNRRFIMSNVLSVPGL
jgi:hypothetical protein